MANTRHQDLVELIGKHEVRFRLVPAQLTSFSCSVPLTWNKVRFALINAKHVPESRGVYVFAVEQPSVGLPPHTYVMYGGKAGDGKNTLRKRFRHYFQEKRRPGRPHVHRLLNYWEDVLSFYYAEVADTAVDIRALEAALNDALLPPFVKNDFTAEVRDAINAFPT